MKYETGRITSSRSHIVEIERKPAAVVLPAVEVLKTPDPFELLQKYAEDFDLRTVARMVRLAGTPSVLYDATFRYTTAGEWSLKAREGVSLETCAWELCRLLGIAE